MAIPVEQCVRGLDRYGDAGFLGRSAGVRDIDLRMIARHSQLPVIRPNYDHSLCVFPLVEERVAVMVTFPDSDRVGRMWSYNHVLLLSRRDYLKVGANPFLLEGMVQKQQEVEGELPVLSFTAPPYEPSPDWGRFSPEVWRVLIASAFSRQRSYVLLSERDDDLAEAVLSCLPPADRSRFYFSTCLMHPEEKSADLLGTVLKGSRGDPQAYQVQWCLVCEPAAEGKNAKNWQEGWWHNDGGGVIDLREGQMSYEGMACENAYAELMAQTIRSEGSPGRRIRLLNEVPKNVGGMEAWEMVRELEEAQAADSLSVIVEKAERIRDLAPGPLGAMGVRLVGAFEGAMTGSDEPMGAQCARRAGDELLEVVRRSPRDQITAELELLTDHLVDRHSGEFHHVFGALVREAESLGDLSKVLLPALDRRIEWLTDQKRGTEAWKEEILWWLNTCQEEIGKKTGLATWVKKWGSQWPEFLGEHPRLFVELAGCQDHAKGARKVLACLLKSVVQNDNGQDDEVLGCIRHISSNIRQHVADRREKAGVVLLEAFRQALAKRQRGVKEECAQDLGGELREIILLSPTEAVIEKFASLANELAQKNSAEFVHIIDPVISAMADEDKVWSAVFPAVHRRISWLSGQKQTEQRHKKELLSWLKTYPQAMGRRADLPGLVEAWHQKWPEFLADNCEWFTSCAEVRNQTEEGGKVLGCLLESLLGDVRRREDARSVAARYLEALWGNGDNMGRYCDEVSTFVKHNPDAVSLVIPESVQRLSSSLDSGGSVQSVKENFVKLLDSVRCQKKHETSVLEKMAPSVRRICYDADLPDGFVWFISQLPKMKVKPQVSKWIADTRDMPNRLDRLAGLLGALLEDEGRTD
jgi:hypothetical protein